MGQLYKNEKKEVTNVSGKCKTIYLYMVFVYCYFERKIYKVFKINLTNSPLS